MVQPLSAFAVVAAQTGVLVHHIQQREQRVLADLHSMESPYGISIDSMCGSGRSNAMSDSKNKKCSASADDLLDIRTHPGTRPDSAMPMEKNIIDVEMMKNAIEKVSHAIVTRVHRDIVEGATFGQGDVSSPDIFPHIAVGLAGCGSGSSSVELNVALRESWERLEQLAIDQLDQHQLAMGGREIGGREKVPMTGVAMEDKQPQARLWRHSDERESGGHGSPPPVVVGSASGSDSTSAVKKRADSCQITAPRSIVAYFTAISIGSSSSRTRSCHHLDVDRKVCFSSTLIKRICQDFAETLSGRKQKSFSVSETLAMMRALEVLLEAIKLGRRRTASASGGSIESKTFSTRTGSLTRAGRNLISVSHGTGTGIGDLLQDSKFLDALQDLRRTFAQVCWMKLDPSNALSPISMLGKTSMTMRRAFIEQCLLPGRFWNKSTFEKEKYHYQRIFEKKEFSGNNSGNENKSNGTPFGQYVYLHFCLKSVSFPVCNDSLCDLLEKFYSRVDVQTIRSFKIELAKVAANEAQKEEMQCVRNSNIAVALAGGELGRRASQMLSSLTDDDDVGDSFLVPRDDNDSDEQGVLGNMERKVMGGILGGKRELVYKMKNGELIYKRKKRQDRFPTMINHLSSLMISVARLKWSLGERYIPDIAEKLQKLFYKISKMEEEKMEEFRITHTRSYPLASLLAACLELKLVSRKQAFSFVTARWFSGPRNAYNRTNGPAAAQQRNEDTASSPSTEEEERYNLYAAWICMYLDLKDVSWMTRIGPPPPISISTGGNGGTGYLHRHLQPAIWEQDMHNQLLFHVAQMLMFNEDEDNRVISPRWRTWCHQAFLSQEDINLTYGYGRERMGNTNTTSSIRRILELRFPPWKAEAIMDSSESIINGTQRIDDGDSRPCEVDLSTKKLKRSTFSGEVGAIMESLVKECADRGMACIPNAIVPLPNSTTSHATIPNSAYRDDSRQLSCRKKEDKANIINGRINGGIFFNGGVQIRALEGRGTNPNSQGIYGRTSHLASKNITSRPQSGGIDQSPTLSPLMRVAALLPTEKQVVAFVEVEDVLPWPPLSHVGYGGREAEGNGSFGRENYNRQNKGDVARATTEQGTTSTGQDRKHDKSDDVKTEIIAYKLHRHNSGTEENDKKGTAFWKPMETREKSELYLQTRLSATAEHRFRQLQDGSRSQRFTAAGLENDGLFNRVHVLPVWRLALIKNGGHVGCGRVGWTAEDMGELFRAVVADTQPTTVGDSEMKDFQGKTTRRETRLNVNKIPP